MHKKILLSLVLFISLAVFSQPVFATTFTYSGRVALSYDDNGNGISGAIIFIQAHGLYGPYTNYYAYSDSDGYFTSEPITYINEGYLHYHVYCYRSPYSFADEEAPQDNSGFYFIPQ
jgi:hypothetical protein